jgi:hypothetical protein
MSDVPTRLLRDALRRAAAEPSSSCLDAAALAAWADGSLGWRERERVESHAASCARCQALVAAMAKTAPASPPRAWWTSKIAWLAPIAAAAAALVVWIAAPDMRMGHPAPAPSTTPASQAAQTPALAAPTPRAAALAPPENAAPAAAAPADRADQAPPARSPAARERRQPVAPSKDLRDAAGPAPSAASTDTHLETSSALSAGAAAADAQAKPSEVESRQLAEAAPRAALDSLQARSVMQNAAKAVSPSLFEIASPDPNVRWRISGTSVQRSADAGANWQTQSSGVRAVLSSGTAPSPTVCWVVGAAGTVARSTDGRTWQQVAFPEAIDLSAVRASDATHAVITAADRRTFATDDGGRTWQTNAR